MRIAFCHNYYQQPGGEDQVFRDESELMESRGHEVWRYERHNDEIEHLSRMAAARKTFWNREVYQELSRKFRAFRPDVVHFTNTFPLLSPAAYRAAAEAGAAVIQSLHNFRLICPGSLLLRDGKPCEKCVGRTLAWPAIRYRCYRDSLAATAVTAGMNAWHRSRGTWTRYVSRFIALTEFAKNRFVAGGLAAEHLRVKPNLVQPSGDSPPNPPADNSEPRALFVGRLSEEKGIEVLLESWRRIAGTCRLDIVGDGPWREQAQRLASALPGTRCHGRLDGPAVRRMMWESDVVIVPSLAYETFGLVVVEAFSTGTPVIVSNHGSLAELVEPGQTGLHFEAGNPLDLATQVQKILADSQTRKRMGEQALVEYHRRYTPDRNYDLLMEIYLEAMRETHRRS